MYPNDAVETIKRGKCKGELFPDTDARNPRPDYDHLGTMVCWHPDYTLGDFQITAPNGRGAVDEPFERDDFQSLEAFVRWLKLAKQATVVLPLYLYDHSGITMRVGHAGDNPFDSAGWDSSDVGAIFTTPARIAELCGDERYVPRDFDGTHEEWITEQLENEVKEYDSYLTGDVYGYIITDDTGAERDSCWGFTGYKYAKIELEAALKYEAGERKAERRAEKAEEAGVHIDVVPA